MRDEFFGHHDIAAMSDDEFDRYRRELYRQHDRWLAEIEEEQRRAATEDRAQEGRETDAAAPYVRKSPPDDLSFTETENALEAAPAVETESSEDEPCFTEVQFDTLAYVLNELRKQWEQDIERAQQRILQATVRLALPGELAEREVHDLRARVIQAEQKIERQLKAAIGDDSVVDLPPGFWKRDIA